LPAPHQSTVQTAYDQGLDQIRLHLTIMIPAG